MAHTRGTALALTGRTSASQTSGPGGGVVLSPIEDPIADSYVAAMEPWSSPFQDAFCRAVAAMFYEVEELAADREDYAGWYILFDPDLCPVRALPYLAQVVGERLPVGIPEADARQWIKDRPNWRRGTLDAMARAAQRRLTGGKVVYLKERLSGIDDVYLVTYADQTPDANAVINEVLKVTPADVILNYNMLVGNPWSAINTSYATWTAVKNAKAKWSDVASGQTGGVVVGS